MTWGLLRIAMGWLFFWAFLDKVFGLGFATVHGKAWLDGVSPTAGFLGHATTGPLAHFYQSQAGNPIFDWLFMTGLCLIGLSLLLGIGTRIAGYAGVLLVLLMFSSLLPPKNNPIMDEHIIYALVLLVFTQLPDVGDTAGLGKWWKSTSLVKRYPVLA